MGRRQSAIKILKIFLYICLSVAALSVFCAVGAWSWLRWQYHLPSEQVVIQQFGSHKADYIRFVNLLQKDPSAAFIDSNGSVDIDGIHSRFVPEYRDLIRKIGAKFVNIGRDGSMEFTLWGFGCTICSDSFMGVLYLPKDHTVATSVWRPTVVTSLASEKLPQRNGSVDTGFYVVPIEPEWFIYRSEYQE